jgi:hypothetical protein
LRNDVRIARITRQCYWLRAQAERTGQIRRD